MRVVLKEQILLLLPDTAEERSALAMWKAGRPDHAFQLAGDPGGHALLHDLGPRVEACREPINIVFDSGEERWRPISNLAHTPFVLRGRSYASVEGFWQGLKFADEDARARTAGLSGRAARTAARGQPPCDSFAFDGRIHAAGGPGHRALMAEACRAKFFQHPAAGDAPAGNRRTTADAPGAQEQRDHPGGADGRHLDAAARQAAQGAFPVICQESIR